MAAMQKVADKKAATAGAAARAADKSKLDAAKAKAAAAAAAMLASAKAKILRGQLDAATQTAMNLQNATVQAQKDRVLEAQAGMLRSMTNEQSSKTLAKEKTEAEIDVLP